MNIICPKDTLAKYINIVSKAVSSKSTMQILECVLLVADAGGLRMTANDMEMAIETDYIGAEVVKEGAVCLEARFFSEIVRKMPDGPIDIKTDLNHVTVFKNGPTELKILGQSPDEFPRMPAFEKDRYIKIPAIKFKNMIRQTIFSVSQDNSKPVFTGGLMEFKDGALNLVTVDGFRISFRREAVVLPDDMANMDNFTLTAVVPGRTLGEIGKILDAEEEGELFVYFTDKHVLFEQKQFTLLSRLIEGDFLRYEKNLSANVATGLTINREELILSLERSMLISRDMVRNPVALKIGGDRMVITSNTEQGTIYDEINAQITGDDLAISFNPRYLTDALKAIDDADVAMDFNTSVSPCIIRSAADNDNYKYLIMATRSLS